MGYWENRQAQMMYEFMEDAEEISQELADIYAKASRQLNYRIEKIYDRFKDKHNLTDEEARQLLNTLRDKTDIDELMQKLAQDPKNADLVKQLESGAYRARIERLENLQGEIDRMMREVYNQEKKVTTSHYVDLANNSYYREIYNIQKQAGFQFSFAAADPKAVALILGSKWSGMNYSERIWKNTNGLAQDIKEQMLLGMLTGKTEGEMAKELANKFATGSYEARRLVRTESNFVNGQMQLNAYEECDADEYEFVAVLDLRTSEICRSLDGKVFKTKDAQPGVNMNPMHPFCRSTTIIHLGDDVVEGLQRRARDPVTGENKLVPANMNYAKWYEQNVAHNPKAQAAEKAVKNMSSDIKQYQAYRALLKGKAGSSVAAFQEIKYNNSELWEFMQLDYKRQNTLRLHPEKALPEMPKIDLPEAKFTRYLFGGDNKAGLAKGENFKERLGYDADNWQKLQRQIKKASNKYPAKVKGQNEYGTLYEQKIVLYGENDTPANVIVGWIQDEKTGSMRMTSTYIKEVK